MDNTKVYIIVINFGTPGHTIECLESVRGNNYELFHLVVVDVLDIDYSVTKITNWIEEKSDNRFSLI